MGNLLKGILISTLFACAPESSEYFVPLGNDARKFGSQFSDVRSFTDQFSDTIEVLRVQEKAEIVNNAQILSWGNQLVFDSVYTFVEAYAQTGADNSLKAKRDIIRIRFSKKQNGLDAYLDSYIGIFPDFKDSTNSLGQSIYINDTISWFGQTFSQVFILKSASLSTFEAICNSQGQLLAFRVPNGKVFTVLN